MLISEVVFLFLRQRALMNALRSIYSFGLFTATQTVTLDDELVWDRKAEGRHAEAKELKQRIRDIISPGRSLGHSDDKEESAALEEMDDDEAMEQRRLFGVL